MDLTEEKEGKDITQELIHNIMENAEKTVSVPLTNQEIYILRQFLEEAFRNVIEDYNEGRREIVPTFNALAPLIRLEAKIKPVEE